LIRPTGETNRAAILPRKWHTCNCDGLRIEATESRWPTGLNTDIGRRHKETSLNEVKMRHLMASMGSIPLCGLKGNGGFGNLYYVLSYKNQYFV